MGWIEDSASVVDALDSAGFARALTSALRNVVPFEYTVIFAYRGDEKPIDIYDDFPALKRQVMVDDYQEGPYLLDPFYLSSHTLAEPQLVRLKDVAPDRFYQAEYFRNYYIQTGLAEEIGYMSTTGGGVSVVISLMREHKAFSAKEFRELKALLPFVDAVTRRHWRGLSAKFDPGRQPDSPRLQSLIDQTFQSLGRNLLTPREAEVVEFTLKGYSAEATGRELGISTGTVRIHKRNIYAKLHISSQGELFSHFISALGQLQVEKTEPQGSE